MDGLPRCRLASWKDIDRWADRVAERIRAAGHPPQTIVGLTRGGWVPSRLLADRLGTKRLLALRAQHWGVTATPSGRAELTEELMGPVEGEAVLVADDITDTGESLELATRHLAERHPKRIESATFLHITHSKFTPTYYAEEIARDDWVWVVFPWNYWEDLATLGRRAREASASTAAARLLLKEKTGWAPSLKDLTEALSGRGAEAPPSAR
ncbi:MAG TPA: phosphoribosyltransferase [Thermoplasmata archaeon]|nr:phosphoribosyltransferase [Thermoplasmata archaeon]